MREEREGENKLHTRQATVAIWPLIHGLVRGQTREIRKGWNASTCRVYAVFFAQETNLFKLVSPRVSSTMTSPVVASGMSICCTQYYRVMENWTGIVNKNRHCDKIVVTGLCVCSSPSSTQRPDAHRGPVNIKRVLLYLHSSHDTRCGVCKSMCMNKVRVWTQINWLMWSQQKFFFHKNYQLQFFLIPSLDKKMENGIQCTKNIRLLRFILNLISRDKFCILDKLFSRNLP